MPSATVQDYLKAIFRLSRGGVAVPLGDLARELELTPGTVTTMVQRMDAVDGLVKYRKREGAVLTRSGRREALRVLRRHRIVELFLVKVVGLGSEEVHAEAERLEHALSDRLVEKLSELLGHPEYDPHGTPIPNARGLVPEEVRLPLVQAELGEYEVVSVGLSSEQSRASFRRMGIEPGRLLRVVEVNREADFLRLEIDREPPFPSQLVLGGAAAAQILVRRMGPVPGTT